MGWASGRGGDEVGTGDCGGRDREGVSSPPIEVLSMVLEAREEFLSFFPSSGLECQGSVRSKR